MRALLPGRLLLIHGIVEQGSGGRKRIAHPEFVPLDEGEQPELPGILPVYVRPGGLPLSQLRNWIGEALARYGPHVIGAVPEPVRIRRMLLAPLEALRQLHGPEPAADPDLLNASASRAHRSLVFDELFCLQLGLAIRKNARARSGSVTIRRRPAGLSARMSEMMPFALTAAQERVLSELLADMATGAPMQRLIQGDVGSGKTMVAWLASLAVTDCGYQVVWLAPTELLAEQHYRHLSPFAETLRLDCALLTGSLTAASKRRLLERIASGEIRCVFGTHALLQEEVRVPRMALGVVDEQHRFGVLQRLSLQRLGRGDTRRATPQPHMLLMSATPIPRSLAMVLYGDMEVSFLDEKPPGRVPVRTRVFAPAARRAVYESLLQELRAGHQAFIVYPLVDTSDQFQEVRDATQMAARMREGPLKEFGIGLVHGRMSVAERDAMMRRFRDGAFAILVATTVIEVGIDIPNATVIVVEHAERFGLAQLHQLRGRVGRGSSPGQCLLIDRGASPLAAERLRVLESEDDGLKIAEADLALRGPGQLMGTSQSGFSDLHLANPVRDMAVLQEARQEALAWLAADPALKTPDSAALRAVLAHRWGKRLQLASVM
jgi:ATP-dependent DNA helicase RecG